MVRYLSCLSQGQLHSQLGQDSFPRRQLFVLALCRICEPIAFMSVIPYAYRMIESFHLTTDESQLAIYAGMLITAFAFAEFSTGVIWGRISDRIGRKPVLIMGLAGTAVSMISFGFVRSFRGAILVRALGGFLNGNVGVLQTTVAELVTKKEHQPRAYSIMPFVWCLGSIIGPAMGGALASPCDAYPWLFSRESLFNTYPFLLPNLVCVFVLLCGIANGLLFLEETHIDKKHERDRGVEFGRLLLSKINLSDYRCRDKSTGYLYGRDASLAPEDPPLGYRSNEGSPLLVSTPSDAISSCDIENACLEKQNRGVRQTFNKQVVLVIVGYGILAYHSVSFDSLMPTFLSEPLMSSTPVLPFKFEGGFALSTKAIGSMMAIQGAYSMIATLWLFPWIIHRVGTLTAFRLVMVVWPLLYFFVPYVLILPTRLQTAGIYFCLLAKITFHVIAFPSNAILLANAAPSNQVLGTINGVAASTACLARAFGPTVTGSIHSAGLKFGCSGLAWWVSGLVCAVGAFQSFCMEEVDGLMDRPQTEEEPSQQPACEPLPHSKAEVVDELVPHLDSLDSLEELDLSMIRA